MKAILIGALLGALIGREQFHREMAFRATLRNDILQGIIEALQEELTPLAPVVPLFDTFDT